MVLGIPETSHVPDNQSITYAKLLPDLIPYLLIVGKTLKINGVGNYPDTSSIHEVLAENRNSGFSRAGKIVICDAFSLKWASEYLCG